MNWKLAKNYGNQFLNELKSFLEGDYSEESRKFLMESHKTMLGVGGWLGFTAFNNLNLREMQEVLGFTRIEYKYANELKMKQSKDDKVDKLQFDDYSEMLALANMFGDVEWRNEILKMECGIK